MKLNIHCSLILKQLKRRNDEKNSKVLSSVYSNASFCSCTFSVQAKEAVSVSGLEYERSMELSYAEEFSVDYYKGGYTLITIGDNDRFLVVPEEKKRRKIWNRGLRF